MTEYKSKIITDNEGKRRYFDKYGNELFEGDIIKFSEDATETYELGLSIDEQLGTDATNPAWIENKRAVPWEYGLYPLNNSDMMEIVKIC